MKKLSYLCAGGLVLALATLNLRADSTWVYAVQISAAAQTSPARITLNWQPDQYGANSYTVYRKAPQDTAWGPGTTLSGSAASFVDNNVTAGAVYEYQIYKAATLGYKGYGYICVGIDAPLTENRGKVMLVVDSTYAANLSTELSRLQSDLVGDGWTVARRDVARNDTPANVKSRITAEYQADTANLKAVFLFGHVPILRSGNLNVDGHQARPMPADSYYGDMNGTWNNPSTLPSDVELMVGRVDFFNMPGNGAPSPWPSEVELLRNYLNKDHTWRHKLVTVPRKALLGNRFGDFSGEAFAASGFRNFEPFVGPGNTVLANEQDNAPTAQRWISMLASGSYLWAYGCGGGSYTTMSAMGTHGSLADVWSTDIVGQDAKAVFFMMFGSWFGEWDSTDNLMRAALATPTLGLTCSWAGRPHWFYHHMGVGMPIGYSARLTMNNSGLYQNQVNPQARGVHIALMGDPTLRMHQVAPPANLKATPNGTAVSLSWTASSDAVAGYHVYRASNPDGPFTRLSSVLVNGTTFSDATASGTNTYMVRTVMLESSPSGTYYNSSQGVFATASASGNGGGDPVQVSVAKVGTGLKLTWNSEPGKTYRVLSKSGLQGTNWTALSAAITATGTSTSWTDTGISSESKRFYQISTQ